MTDRLLPKPRPTSTYRCKGRRKVPALHATEQLLVMLDCADADALLVKLDSLDIRPHVSLGPEHARCVFVSEYQLLVHMQS